MEATTLGAARDSALVPASALLQLRAALESDRDAREALSASHAEEVAELTGQVDSDSVLERELAEAAVARASEAIRDIDVALARMDDGTYGTCDSCRAEIPLERLQVIPQARLCVRCSGQRSRVLG